MWQRSWRGEQGNGGTCSGGWVAVEGEQAAEEGGRARKAAGGLAAV